MVCFLMNYYETRSMLGSCSPTHVCVDESLNLVLPSLKRLAYHLKQFTAIHSSCPVCNNENVI